MKTGGMKVGRGRPAMASLTVAAVASAALISQRLGAFELPGCGFDSACARAASSAWGTLPGLAWPLSHVGLAYALGLLGACLLAGGPIGRGLLRVVRVGALGSLLLSGVMLFEGYLCPYCLAFHAANVVAWWLLERTARTPTSRAVWSTFGGGFVAVTALLALAERGYRAAAEAQGERELARSTGEILRAPAEAEPFTGRYLAGAEQAAIRIVVFSDYQCPDCRRIELESRELLASRSDVSFSAKHFPFCSACNDRFVELGTNPHPNACWAARAAEAAGILGGSDGFYRMHRWLFDRRGGFTNAELRTGLADLGFDAHEFETTMKSSETLARVRADIDEAILYGLHHTPMIFVNGVELKGWHAPNALLRTAATVAQSKPASASARAAGDRPPSSFERHMADWREQPKRAIASASRHRWRGAAEASVEVVVWGDYQEPGTAALDERIRVALGDLPNVRYSFRHYPFDQTCNPSVTRTVHPLACLAARAAEAAGRMGDRLAYWKLHDWLMRNPADVEEQRLLEVVASFGIDPDGLRARMDSPEVQAAIEQDARAAKALGIKSIPFLTIDGQFVPRWNLKDESVPESIMAEAAAR